MKLHKGTIYFYGLNGIENLEEMIRLIKECRYDVYSDIFDIESAEIGEWHDDISINLRDCTQDNYEELFDREKQLQILIDKKEELMESVDSIDDEISRLSGRVEER